MFIISQTSLVKRDYFGVGIQRQV